LISPFIFSSGLLHINEIKKSEAFLQAPLLVSLFTYSHASDTSQVGDTVRLLVQDVDIPRRRLSLALEKLDDVQQLGTAIQPAASGQKRPIEPLNSSSLNSSSSKRVKQ
jgi:hypothetical protein